MTARISPAGELELVGEAGLASLLMAAMGASAVALAPAGHGRLYLDRTTGQLLVSVDGQNFQPVMAGAIGFDVSGLTVGVQTTTVSLTELRDGDFGVLLANIGGSGSDGGFRSDQRVRAFQRAGGVCVNMGNTLNLQAGSTGSSVGGASTIQAGAGEMQASFVGQVAGQTSVWRARGVYWLYNQGR